jgi:hypothetical protein
MSQLDPVHAPTSHFLNIHFNIFLLSKPVSSKWSLSLRFLHQNPVYVSPLPTRVTCPAHFIFLDLITRTIVGEKYRSLSSLCILLQSSVTSFLWGPNIPHGLPNFVPFKNVQTFKPKLLEIQQFTPLSSGIGTVGVYPCSPASIVAQLRVDDSAHRLVATCFPHEAHSCITLYHTRWYVHTVYNYLLYLSSLPKVM